MHPLLSLPGSDAKVNPGAEVEREPQRRAELLDRDLVVLEQRLRPSTVVPRIGKVIATASFRKLVKIVISPCYTCNIYRYRERELVESDSESISLLNVHFFLSRPCGTYANAAAGFVSRARTVYQTPHNNACRTRVPTPRPFSEQPAPLTYLYGHIYSHTHCALVLIFFSSSAVVQKVGNRPLASLSFILNCLVRFLLRPSLQFQLSYGHFTPCLLNACVSTKSRTNRPPAVQLSN